MELHVSSQATTQERLAVLDRWYRNQLRDALAQLTSKWEVELGVTASRWGVKRMKTKWGSCNPTSGSIWVNSELTKKPLECLEYIVVHELVHLLVPRHGEAFGSKMDSCLPNWRLRRDLLNSSPLAHEEWVY